MGQVYSSPNAVQDRGPLQAGLSSPASFGRTTSEDRLADDAPTRYLAGFPTREPLALTLQLRGCREGAGHARKRFLVDRAMLAGMSMRGDLSWTGGRPGDRETGVVGAWSGQR
jgi:hypothetical protein